MPTAASSTSFSGRTRRAVEDVGHLLRFRTASARRRRATAGVAGTFLFLTLASGIIPAFVPGATVSMSAQDAAILLPTGFAAFLALATVSAVASGGGRELLAREHAVAYPLSPTTDHLGALLLAPLNIAWLLQGWVLLGTMAYVAGPDGLLAAQLGVLVWLATATAGAQAVAWSLEAVRRRPHGVVLVRAALLGVAVAGIFVQASGQLADWLDRLPTTWIVVGVLDGFSWRWLATLGVELGLLVVLVALGAVPAHLAARRTPRDELRVESDVHPARRSSRWVVAALVRTDRASVWRAVPMRRGLAVLAIAPGVIALGGHLPWYTMTVLPGLVASGAALLFGVNAWCLDGRGGLWRESLPVDPSSVFTARTIVLAEFLLVASAVTLALAALGAGVPTASELAAVLSVWAVVTVQVVAAAMRWSDRRPRAVDLRWARATPAPPLAMVGYSSRLALSTTMTGLVFSGLARVPDWQLAPMLAVVFLAWSTARLLRTRRRWLDPVSRARVVVAVAA